MYAPRHAGVVANRHVVSAAGSMGKCGAALMNQSIALCLADGIGNGRASHFGAAGWSVAVLAVNCSVPFNSIRMPSTVGRNTVDSQQQHALIQAQAEYRPRIIPT